MVNGVKWGYGVSHGIQIILEKLHYGLGYSLSVQVFAEVVGNGLVFSAPLLLLPYFYSSVVFHCWRKKATKGTRKNQSTRCTKTVLRLLFQYRNHATVNFQCFSNVVSAAALSGTSQTVHLCYPVLTPPLSVCSIIKFRGKYFIDNFNRALYYCFCYILDWCKPDST